MSRLALPLAFAPLPAFAHAGPHLHPHGIGDALAAVAVVTLVAALAWFTLLRR